MTARTSEGQSTSLILLLSILENYSGWLNDRNKCWRANRDFAYSQLKEYEMDAEWNRADFDLWRGRIIYNEAMCSVEDSIRDLIDALKKNPFPGQRKRLLSIATELFPYVEIVFEPEVESRHWCHSGSPEVSYKGEDLWRKIFADASISCDIDKISFPDVSDIDIGDVEGKLYQLVGGEGYLRASEVALALHIKERTKVYATVRNRLQERGWSWINKKVKGKQMKVVFPPES